MSVLYIGFVALRIMIIVVIFYATNQDKFYALILCILFLLGIFVDYFAGSRLHKFYRY